MLLPAITTTTDELQQILELQRLNLKQHLSGEEMQGQGFVTLQHSLDILQEMHRLAPSILVKDGDKVVGYALTELIECRELMPELEPMFALMDRLTWEDQPISHYPYYVMGQVCIDKEYRGLGIFESLYRHHKKIYSSSFDLLLTEISTRNTRSLRAHEKVGFKTIHTHRDELDEWAVVAWDWR